MNEVEKINNYIINNELDIDRIIDDFTPYIKTVINNFCGDKLNAEDKEEILTDTFFVFWKNNSFNITYLEAYLAGIAKNLVKEKFKKNKISYNISDYENILEYYDNIDLFSERRELLDELEKNYKSLKEVDLKILNLFYYQDKPIKVIAKEVNLSESNVKSKIYRIKKKLKKEIGKGGA